MLFANVTSVGFAPVRPLVSACWTTRIAGATQSNNSPTLLSAAFRKVQIEVSHRKWTRGAVSTWSESRSWPPGMTTFPAYGGIYASVEAYALLRSSLAPEDIPRASLNGRIFNLRMFHCFHAIQHPGQDGSMHWFSSPCGCIGAYLTYFIGYLTTDRTRHSLSRLVIAYRRAVCRYQTAALALSFLMLEISRQTPVLPRNCVAFWNLNREPSVTQASLRPLNTFGSFFGTTACYVLFFSSSATGRFLAL